MNGAQGNPFYADIAQYTKHVRAGLGHVWIPNTKAGPAASVPVQLGRASSRWAESDAKGAADDAQKDWEAGK